MYEVDPEEAEIGIGETLEVRVWAFPKAVGEFTDSLICLIKNNPWPYKINLHCEGIIPLLNISKKEIIFERMLVGKVVTNSFDLRNDSLAQIRWKAINVEELKI